MLTQRDKQLLIYLERNKAISTQQATNIFFEGLEKSAIRRLNQLEDLELIESYKIGTQKIYKWPGAKELSQHDIYILDFYAWVYGSGGELIEFKKTPHYFNNLLIPDGLFKFKIPYEGHSYTIYVLLEIDYTHYTENSKLNVWYEKLYREDVLKEYCGTAQFPFVIVARPTPGIRYNSKNFNIIYTDLKFSNILPLMLT